MEGFENARIFLDKYTKYTSVNFLQYLYCFNLLFISVVPCITTLIFCMILTIFCIIHNMYYATIECKRIWSLDKVLIPSRRTQAPRKHTQQYNERSEQKTDGKKLGCVCTPNIFSIIRSTMFGERGKEKHNFDNCLFFPLPPAAQSG